MSRLLSKDFLSGVMFIAFGLGALWFGRHLQMGTTVRMGPGYVPHMLAYAGDLRRAARDAGTPEAAQKIQQSAAALEKTALARVGQDHPTIGKLLDLLA